MKRAPDGDPITQLQQIALDFDYDHDLPVPSGLLSTRSGKPDQTPALSSFLWQSTARRPNSSSG